MRFNDRKKSKYNNNFIVRQKYKKKLILEFAYLIGEHEKSIALIVMKQHRWCND